MVDAFAIAATLLVIASIEGIRRAHTSTLTLQLIPFGRWRSSRGISLGREFYLTSPFLPLASPVIVDRAAASRGSNLSDRRLIARLKSRLRRTRTELTLLQATGTVGLVLLVVYVPLASTHFGGWGLLQAMVTVVMLCIAQALWVWSLLLSFRIPRGEAAKRAIKLVNPFAIGRSTEIAAAGMVEGTPAVGVAVALLGRDEAVRQLRPLIYDAFYGNDVFADRDVLTTIATEAEWKTQLGEMPANAGAAMCPRCGAEFSQAIAECSDCQSVRLVHVSV